VRVALSALTNRARLPSRLKTTVFFFTPGTKLRPVMVIVSPIPRFRGAIFETVGYGAGVAASAAATGTAAVTARVVRSRRLVMGIAPLCRSWAASLERSWT
jgi:hypothetical protein